MATLPTADLLRHDLSSLVLQPGDVGILDAGPFGEDAMLGASKVHSPTLTVLDQMPIGLAVYDTDGRLVHSNPHFARLAGGSHIPSRPAGPRRRWAGWDDDGQELSPDRFPCRRALRGETVNPGVDLLHYHPDGSENWLTVSASPIADPGQDVPLGVVLFFADARRPAAAEPDAIIRLLGRFADGSGNGVWAADVATTTFAYRNSRHHELSSDPGATRLSSWLEHLSDADRPRVRACHESVRAGGVGHVEFVLSGRDGHGRRVRETCFPVRDAGGQVVMIAGIVGLIEETPQVRRPLFVIGDPATGASALGDPTTMRFGDLAALMNVADCLRPGCVVVDMATCPDAETGLARFLAKLPATLPVIVIGKPQTHAATAIAAMRAGAVDYLIPPFVDEVFAAAIVRATTLIPDALPRVQGKTDTIDRLGCLTRRERQVLTGLKAGGTNKSIARELGISPRTVELHRAHLMERMNVPNLATLLRVAQHSELG